MREAGREDLNMRHQPESEGRPPLSAPELPSRERKDSARLVGAWLPKDDLDRAWALMQELVREANEAQKRRPTPMSLRNRRQRARRPPVVGP
jgi:hypothetical protein